MRRPWPTGGCRAKNKQNSLKAYNNNNNYYYYYYYYYYLTAIGLSPGGSGYLTCIKI
jgi:hypothetical protein